MPRINFCEDIANMNWRKRCAKQELELFILDGLAALRQDGQECNSSGICVVEFTVEPNGEVTDIVLVKNIEYPCGQIAVRVIEFMQEDIFWRPGYQDGEPVRTRMTQRIVFSNNQFASPRN